MSDDMLEIEKIAELRRANDLRECELELLGRIADRPLLRNFLQTISHWWQPDKLEHMRRNY